MPRYNSTFFILRYDVDIFGYSKTGIIYNQGRMQLRLNNHIRLQVIPLVYRPAQLLFYFTQKRVFCLKLQLTLHIHLMPGNFFNPDQGTSLFKAVKTPPFNYPLFVYMVGSNFWPVLRPAAEEQICLRPQF